jgi:hypothetical protein
MVPVGVNGKLESSIVQVDDNDLARNEHLWQQLSVAREIYDVDVNIIANGMMNQLPKPCRPIRRKFNRILAKMCGPWR